MEYPPPIAMQERRRIKAMEALKEARKESNTRKANRRTWRLEKNKSFENGNVKPAGTPYEVAKEKGVIVESVFLCHKCNYKCARTKTLEKHMDTKHKIYKISSCEHCRIYHASQNDMKDHMELHKLEEN